MSHKINEILKKALEGENLSYLTKKLGLPNGLLHRLVKEGRSPSLNNIDALVIIADYLGLSLEQLLTGKEKNRVLTSVQFEDEKRKYKVTLERIK
jgi:hypothetical protein